MKIQSAILAALLTISSLSARPKGESTVVGCFLIEIIGSYLRESGPVYHEYDVRIECEYFNQKGKARKASFLTKTDENGYFKLEKVPDGNYVLKAVEFIFERGGRITLASKYGRADMSDQTRYWGMLAGMMMDNAVALQQDHIELEQHSGIIDLGITYLQIKADEQAIDAGMPQTSPDGRPPWRRLSIRERNSMVDLFLINSSTHPALDEQPLGMNAMLYRKAAPAIYFGLQ